MPSSPSPSPSRHQQQQASPVGLTTAQNPPAHKASSSQLMINRRFVFGADVSAKGGVRYLDARVVLWSAGKSLVLYNTQGGQQAVIQSSEECETITAIAISANRRIVAVAEGGAVPRIAIYFYEPGEQLSNAFRRRRLLMVPDIGAAEYVSLGLSQDGRYLVSQGGAPEWTLVYWDVERGKMVARVPALPEVTTASQDKQLITQVSISPADATVVCLTGKNGIFQFFDLVDNQLVPTSITVHNDGKVRVSTSYMAHVWLPQDGTDRLVVSTDNGDLLLIEDGVYVSPLPLSPSDGLAIHALIPYSRGFVCGGELGVVTVFERTDDKELYRKAGVVRITANGTSEGGATNGPRPMVLDDSKMPLPPPSIVNFSVAPSNVDEMLALMTSDKQLYSINLSNVDLLKSDERMWEPVCQVFHSGPVTAVDVCMWKPLIATGGRDCKIILWNYQTRTVACARRFTSEVSCLSLHPTGMYLLAGFEDSLLYMNVYKDDIWPARTLPIRSCGVCRFSGGGQYFAAAQPTVVHVFYTYTCEQLGHLRGHNGRIRSLQFAHDDDTRVITAGDDGTIMEFSLRDYHKVRDHTMKAIKYNSAVSEERFVWAAGNDRRLRMFDRSTMQQLGEYPLNNASILSMAIGPKVHLLFGACEDGTVRVFNTELGEKQSMEQEVGATNIMVESWRAHVGPVSQIVVTDDELLLVTVGEDGLVTLWDVTAPNREHHREVTYATDVLFDREELESKIATIRELRMQVAELKQRIVQQQMRRHRNHEEEMQVLERGYNEEHTRQERELQALAEEKNEQAIRFSEFIADLATRQQKENAHVRKDYDDKIRSMKEQKAGLEQKLDDQRRLYLSEKRRITAAAEQERIADEEKHTAVINQLISRSDNCMQGNAADDVDAELLIRLIEEDADEEIMGMKEAYQRRRRDQEEELTALQSVNSALQAKENLTRADLDAKKADIADKLKQQATLETQVDGLRRDIEALQIELQDRADTIVDKDRRIIELQRKNQELEKLKFVLDYKIRELKAQIDPRDEEIRAAKEKLKDMDAEAERYYSSNDALVLQIRNWQNKVKGQRRELSKQSEKLTEATEYQSRLWTELSDLASEKDPKQLKNKAKVLFDHYTTPEGRVAAPAKLLSSRTAADELSNFNRERDYLEGNMNGLKRKLAKDTESGRDDKMRIVKENIILTREVNDLRRDARSLIVKAGLLDDVGQCSLFEGDVAAKKTTAGGDAEHEKSAISSHRGDTERHDRSASGNSAAAVDEPINTLSAEERLAEIDLLKQRLRTLAQEKQRSTLRKTKS